MKSTQKFSTGVGPGPLAARRDAERARRARLQERPGARGSGGGAGGGAGLGGGRVNVEWLSLRVFRRGLFAHRFSFRANLAVGFAPRVRKQIEDSWRRLMQTSSQVVHHEGEQVRCSRCVGKVVITRKQFCGPLLGYAASIPRISSQEILVMRFVCSLRWHRYS